MARRGVTTENLGEFLVENVAFEPNTGCWLWTDCDNGVGYGQLYINGKAHTAHRASYEYHHGPIPDGMFVCHKCDVRACINPDHLFVGNKHHNMQDAASKGRINTQILTADDVREIRAHLASNNKRGEQSKLAKKYGVTRYTISAIYKNKIWKWAA